MKPIKRRTALRLGIPAAFAVAGVQPAGATSLDGKGNDVCPCFFGITEAVLDGDETIEVSGPCAVANPPEEVTVHVQVRGAEGARAVGAATFTCTATEGADDEDSFSVSAPINGTNRFERGEEIRIDATAHINPDDKPAIGAGRWSWTGTLS
jgi:hypothetical protein